MSWKFLLVRRVSELTCLPQKRNTDSEIVQNGGPGCSSLEGLLQENGPFLWQYGTFAPVPNPWTWVNLTNMVWVEQPVGTGFTQGTADVTDETGVASEFLGFWKNFVDTFGLQNRKVYISGESYAGYYVPYIADAMLNSNDTVYYDVESILIYDPSTSTEAVQQQSRYSTFLNVPFAYGIPSSCGSLRRLLRATFFFQCIIYGFSS